MHELLKLAKRKKDKEDNGPGMGTAGALGGAAVGGFVGAKQLRDGSKGIVRNTMVAVPGVDANLAGAKLHANKAFKFTGALRGGSAGLIGSSIGNTDEDGNTSNVVNTLKGATAGALAAPYLEAGINAVRNKINPNRKSKYMDEFKGERGELASSIRQKRTADRKVYNASQQDAWNKTRGNVGFLTKDEKTKWNKNYSDYHTANKHSNSKAKAQLKDLKQKINTPTDLKKLKIGGFGGFGRAAAIGGLGALGYSMYKNKKNKENQ